MTGDSLENLLLDFLFTTPAIVPQLFCLETRQTARESPSALEHGGLEPLNNQCHIQGDEVRNSVLSSTEALCHDECGSAHVSSQHNMSNNASNSDVNLSD